MEPRKDRQTLLIVLITTVSTLLVCIAVALVIVLVRGSDKKASSSAPYTYYQTTPAEEASSSPAAGQGQESQAMTSTSEGQGTGMATGSQATYNINAVIPASLQDSDGQILSSAVENEIHFRQDHTFTFDNLVSGSKIQYTGTFQVYQTEGGKRIISCYITSDIGTKDIAYNRTFFLYEQKKNEWTYLGKDRDTLHWHETMKPAKKGNELQVGAAVYPGSYDKEYEGVWLVRDGSGIDLALAIDDIGEGTMKASVAAGQMFNLEITGIVYLPDHTGYCFVGYEVLGQYQFLGMWLKIELRDNKVILTPLESEPIENSPIPIPQESFTDGQQLVITEHMTQEEYKAYLEQKQQQGTP